MQVPKFLLDFLRKYHYEIDCILQYNKRKEVYVLKLRQNNKYYLLKSYDKDKTPKNIKNKFIIEKAFYEKNNNLKNIPKLIISYDNILILEYFNSITLRDYLIKKEYKKDFVINLINEIKLFDTELYRKESSNINYDNIFHYISSLCNSHPFQARNININFFDKFLNKIIYKILVIKIKKIFSKNKKFNLKKGFSHNDFHYNNILISNTNSIKFIDFENVKYQGYFEIDILFLIVLMEVYLDEYSIEYKIMNQYLKELFLKDNFLENIYNLFKIAISANKKFYVDSKKNSLNKFQKIMLIFKLLRNSK